MNLPETRSLIAHDLRRIIPLWACVFLVGCGVNAKKDSDALDRVLGNPISIDAIELGAIYRTNYLTGEDAQAFLGALQRTNRIPVSKRGRVEHTGWVVLRSGTNEAAVMGIYDGETYSFGKYAFKLRTPPNVHR
jgi:hypothetical protein